MYSTYALLLVLCLPAAAQNPISAPALRADRPTLTSLGLQVTYAGDDNRNANATVQYRASGESAWRTGLPLLRVLPETVTAAAVPRQFAGSIVDLKPGTTYEISVRVQDPDGFDTTLTGTSTTRRVPPANPANPRIINVNSVATLQSALGAAQPGDVITLANGTYSIQWLQIGANGNATNPIVLRGASQSGVVIDGGGCGDCNILEIYSSYFTLESLTVQNGFQAVRFQGSSAQGNVMRRVTIRNVQNGVNGRGTQSDFYFGDNTLTGRMQFPKIYDTDNGASSDNYGIALFGAGHVVAHNNISGFANCISMGAAGNRAIDIYGNDITYSYDDAVELDSSQGNTRVFRNRFTNTYTGVSLQPVSGGPAYVFRNVGYNIAYEPLKFHSRATSPSQDPSGVYVLHNTFVSPVRALNMGSPLPNHNSRILNNIFIGPASQNGGQTVDWVAPLNQVTFDYNGYYPDGAFFFRPPGSTGTAPTFASVFSKYGLEQHGRLLTAGTLVNSLVGPASYSTYQNPKDLSLAAGSPALDAATPLANFNDSYSGAAPDLGALESGCVVPVYGVRPAGTDETNQAVACAIAQPAGTPPNPVSVSPSGRAGSLTTYTVVLTDPNGWQDITKIALLFGASPVIGSSCVVEVDLPSRAMYLWNDAGSARTALSSAPTIQNSRCTFTASGTSVTASQTPNQIVWKVNVRFLNNFGAQKSIYVKADDATASSGWKLMGAVR